MPSPLAGVLNVTPDSFSDGGKFLKIEAACLRPAHCRGRSRLAGLGGESTGPGSVEVSGRRTPASSSGIEAFEQISGVDHLHRHVESRGRSQMPLHGAKVINDVTALCRDPAMAEVVAEAVPVILMHAKEARPDNPRSPALRRRDFDGEGLF